MKFLWLIFFSVGVALYGEVSTFTWESDLTKSLLLSQKTNKQLLLFFAGSDWSVPSMKMKKEILDSSDFRESLQDYFIFMQVDFPEYHQLTDQQLLQNRLLKEKYHITRLPCLLLLDQNQREIARLDYLPEKKEQLAQQLLHFIAIDKTLGANLSLLKNKVALSGNKLKELYKIAEELGREEDTAFLIQNGIDSEEGGFFMLKAYQKKVQSGQISHEETKSLRQKLLSSQEEDIVYSVALSDFQELSKTGAKVGLVELIAPLQEYLARYGQSRSENVWRTEMMIAQVYMTFDLYEKAYHYAKKAHEKAPIEFKTEIARSLTYIEKQGD